MAHKCNTVDDGKKWTSRIKGNPDGKLRINKENSKGVFSGKHENSNEDLFGRCFEATGQTPHRIWFVVPANNHLYMGHLNGTEEINGFRFVINVDDLSVGLDEIINRKKDALPDEEWVAVKT